MKDGDCAATATTTTTTNSGLASPTPMAMSVALGAVVFAVYSTTVFPSVPGGDR